MNPRTPVWPLVVSAVAVFLGVVHLLVVTGVLWSTVQWSKSANADYATSGTTNTDTGGGSSTGATPDNLPPLDGTVEGFYGQPINWEQCSNDRIVNTYSGDPMNPENFECAWLQAPLDWDQPDGEVIVLSIAKHRGRNSTGEALFFNLGGPGGSAVDSIVSQVQDNLGSRLVDAYDIVAMDPRGIGASTPIKCLTDEERDERNAGTGSTSTIGLTPEEIAQKAKDDAAKYAAGCEKHSGDLFRYIDTLSVAKDFDMARAAMKQDVFNYLGYSYGTFIGAIYADSFPDKVGRLVLDGAVDPAADVDTVSALQMRGFEASLRHWVEDCHTSTRCPLSGTVDESMAEISAFLTRLEGQPMPTSDIDRPLTQNLALTAIIGLLYSTKTYSVLTSAMSDALMDNDGSGLLFVADILNSRNDDGTYDSPGSDGLVAVNNLDYAPVGTLEQWAAEAEALKAELTVFGPFSGWTSASVAGWPTEHAERRPVSATGAAPIVVVGTTNDPATPYVMAESLAKQLSSGVLVTWEGWDHTAYSSDGSRCVANAVEGYLVDGTVPEDGLRCTD